MQGWRDAGQAVLLSEHTPHEDGGRSLVEVDVRKHLQTLQSKDSLPPPTLPPPSITRLPGPSPNGRRNNTAVWFRRSSSV